MVDLKRQYLGINQYGQSTSSKPVTNTINNVYTNSNIVNSNSNLTKKDLNNKYVNKKESNIITTKIDINNANINKPTNIEPPSTGKYIDFKNKFLNGTNS